MAAPCWTLNVEFLPFAPYRNPAMSYAEIEAELERLEPDELRRLALKSWTAFVRKEGRTHGGHECEETDPALLTALDEAIDRADATPGQGHAGRQVRDRLREWTSK